MIKHITLLLVLIPSFILAAEDIKKTRAVQTKAIELFQSILPIRELHSIILDYLNGWSQDNMLDVKTDSPILKVKISPNSKFLCAIQERNESNKSYVLYLFHLELENGENKLIDIRLDFQIHKITYSPDSTYVCVAGFKNKTCYILNLGDLTYQSLKTDHEIVELTWASQNDLFATGGWDNKAKIWKKTENTFEFMQDLTGHTEAVSGTCFAPDGQRIATASRDKTVKVWERAHQTYHLTQTLEGHEQVIYNVKFAPKSNIIASYDTYSIIKIWRHNGVKYLCAQTLTEHRNSGFHPLLTNFNFTADGTMLLASTKHAKGVLWQVDGTLYSPVQVFDFGCTPMVFSSDGNYIACGNKNQLELRKKNGINYDVYQNFPNNTIHFLDFSPDNRFLASGSGTDNSIKLWKNQAVEIILAYSLRAHKK